MSMEYNATVATLSAATAGVIAQLPDSGQLDALSRWPVTIALIALAAWSVWLMYRQADRARMSLDNMATKIGELCKELAQRPCIRNPKND